MIRRRENAIAHFAKIPLIVLEEVQQAIVIGRSTVPVRTGRLRDSIGILGWEPETAKTLAGTLVEYAHFVEFGTVHMHARPYWTPAIWEAFYRIRERIQSEVIRKGLE